MKRLFHVLLIAAMVISLLPLMALPAIANGGPQAICVPWQPSNTATPHYTYSGAAHTLKGIARGGATAYWWDFGDGSRYPAVDWATITNPYNLGASHTYTGSSGQLFIATLHVKDGSDNEAQDTYPVRIFESSNLEIQSHADVRINMSIDQGLWYLHTNMTRSTYGPGEPGYDQPYGYWNYTATSGLEYVLSATGAAVDAFQLHGSRANGDYNGDPYVETVQRGLNYLLANAYSYSIGVQPAGNPDANGNGIGIVINRTSSLSDLRQTYVGGICMVALASSGTPSRVAAVGRNNIYGSTYAAIVQDMVDFFAWGQVDGGSGRGGWRYYANYSGSDMSTTQWPALGMLAAESNMGSTVPDFVRDELGIYLAYIQHTDLNDYNGAFGYSSPIGDSYLNMTKQGAGIICHEFIGTPLTDPAVESAIGYIYRHWNDAGWDWYDTRLFRNSYEMYAIMKSMRIPDPDILRITQYDYNAGSQTANSFDWYYKPSGQTNVGIAYHLIQNQQTDGQWDDNVGSNQVKDAFSTAWGVLILLKGVSIIPPVAQICNCGDLEFDLGQDIPLDGSCSYHPDLARSIVSYEWDFDYDGTFNTDATGITTTIVGGFPATDHYPIALRVTDNNPAALGGPQTDIVFCDVYVHPPCLDPQADANGPYLGTPGVPLQLNASGTTDPDTDFGYLTFEWDLDNDGLFGTDDDDCFGETDDALGVNPTFTWASNYIGVIGLKVSDTCDLCSEPGSCPWYTGFDTDYTTVAISDNHPPVSDPNGPYTASPSATISLDGSGSSDPDGDDIAFAWDLDNDGDFDDSTDMNPSFTVGAVIETIYPICLRVTDTSQEYDIACTSITIVGDGPGPDTEVGGEVYPDNKLVVLTPWIVLAVIMAFGTVVFIRRRQNQKQS